MSWILVIYIYAGAFAKGDSVAISTIPMPNQKACMAAGQQAAGLVKGSAKEFRFVCLEGGAA
jgi:hypothetical protein